MIYLGAIGIFLFLKSLKVEIKSLRQTQRAFILFDFMFILQRVFFIFSDYERNDNGLTSMYYQFIILGYICIIIGLLFIIYVIEAYVITKSNHIISLIVLIILVVNIVMLFFPNLVPFIRYVNYCLFYFEGLLLLSIYFYLIINTSGRLRKKSMVIFLGFIIFIIGIILDSDALVTSGLSSPFYYPFLSAIGFTAFIYAQIMN